MSDNYEPAGRLTEEMELEEDLTDFGLVEPSYGFSMVHDRVFVTWYENRHEGTGDDFVFVSEPKAVELPEHQAEQVRDLLNHQNDKLQSLLQTFIESDGTTDCADPSTPPDDLDKPFSPNP